MGSHPRFLIAPGDPRVHGVATLDDGERFGAKNVHPPASSQESTASGSERMEAVPSVICPNVTFEASSSRLAISWLKPPSLI
jgi:hypothetical protein